METVATGSYLWSVELLGDAEKRLLARFGVFAGGFSLDRSNRPYFSVLGTVREYALEQLETSGELLDGEDIEALGRARTEGEALSLDDAVGFALQPD